MAPTDDDNDDILQAGEEEPQEPAEEEAAPMEVDEQPQAQEEAPEAEETAAAASAVKEELAAAELKQEANDPAVSVEEAAAVEAVKTSESIHRECAEEEVEAESKEDHENEETTAAAGVKKEGGVNNEETNDEEEPMEMPTEHILYPGGGNFNKLRKKQTFLEKLLKDNVEGYIGSNSKREFVKEKILDKIPGGLKVFSKEKGEVYVPDQHEAFDRVSQKIRDIKKYRLKAANNTTSPRRVSQKRTSTPRAPQPAKRRRDPAEEGVKDKLILEMRAEITRLRANVMTAHEKIRTLEQLHAHDEERIQHLQEELGIKKGPEAVARAMAKAAASATAAAVTATAAAAAEAAAIAEAAAAVDADKYNNEQGEEDDPEGEPFPKKQRVEKVDAENTIAV